MDLEDNDIVPDKAILNVVFAPSTLFQIEDTCELSVIPPHSSFSFISSSPTKVPDSNPEPLLEIIFDDNEKELNVSEPPCKKLKVCAEGQKSLTNCQAASSSTSEDKGSSDSTDPTLPSMKSKRKTKCWSMWRAEDHPGESPPSSVYKLPDPIPLPCFSHNLQLNIKNNGILANESGIVQESTAHLRGMTAGYPSSTEYEEYCRTIVTAYPELGVPNPSKALWSCFKETFTKSMRNHRHAEKRALRKNKEVSLKSFTKAAPVGSTQEPTPCTSSNTSNTGIGPLEAAHVEELRRVGAAGDTEHTKRLLMETKDYRKHWFANNDKHFEEIIRAWPHLNKCELMVYDFLVSVETESETIYEKYAGMAEKMAKLYEVEFDLQKDLDQRNLLAKVQNEIAWKNNKKNEFSLSIHEAGKDIDSIQVIREESLRVVVYHCDDKITEAYLLLFGGRMQLRDLSAFQITLTLLASYFVFDIKYPAPYLPLLATLEYYFLNSQSYVLPTAAVKVRSQLENL